MKKNNIEEEVINEEGIVEKPQGKPVKNFRARVKMFENNVVVVNPMQPRESNRKMIRARVRRNRATVFTLTWMPTIPIP